MPASRISLDKALAQTRTGDIWLFRGRTAADRTIQVTTNAPVNHVGMTVALDDLPPLMWHAELGRSLPDLWSGTRHRGAQLHDLHSSVLTWSKKYGQRAWFRQLDHPIDREMEDAVLRTIARIDGTPFPTPTQLASRWLLARTPRLKQKMADRELETAYCAEVVALTYEAMGLLPGGRTSWYDPGRFWSGDRLHMLRGAKLGREIAVDFTPTKAGSPAPPGSGDPGEGARVRLAAIRRPWDAVSQRLPSAFQRG